MSTGEGIKLTDEEAHKEIDKVHTLIEQCLVHYMNQKQVKDILYQQQSIAPSITETIWRRLEADNPDFFKAYYLRLVVNDQINEFNNLLGRQAALMNRVDPRKASFPPGFNNASHMPEKPRDVYDTCFFHKMENMQHPAVSRVLMSGFNSCDRPSIQPGMQHHALDRSTQSRRMDVPSYMMLARNSNVGMNGIGIKSEGGYLDDSAFVYQTTGGNVLGAHPTIQHAPISPFGSVDPNLQTRMDDQSSFEYFRQVSQNIGLPRLAADFTNRSDALRFSNPAFLLPEIDNFYDSQGNTVEHQGPTTRRRMM